MVSSPETFGWAIVSGYSDEVKEGAAALLKLRTQLNMEQREELFSKDPEGMIPAERGLYRCLQERTAAGSELSGEVEFDPAGRDAGRNPAGSGAGEDDPGGVHCEGRREHCAVPGRAVTRRTGQVFFFDNHGFVIVTGRMAGIAIIPSEQRKQRFSKHKFSERRG